MKEVLVVDDDMAIRGMLSISLESIGYKITEATSADEAINLLKNKAFPLVILDMGMPPNEHLPTEGINVLDWIIQQELASRVIVLTGQDADSTSYQAILHGAFDFFSKPVQFTLLVSSLQRAELFNKQMAKIEQKENLCKIELEVIIGDGVKNVRNAAEQKLLRRVLKKTGFNVHETGRRLGLKRENVYYLIKKYGIERYDF
jgi:DNA-binding NtrC family response regulator